MNTSLSWVVNCDSSSLAYTDSIYSRRAAAYIGWFSVFGSTDVRRAYIVYDRYERDADDDRPEVSSFPVSYRCRSQ